MSPTRKARNFRSPRGKSLPEGPDPPTSSRQFAEAVAEALRRDFGGTHRAVKTVARLTGANGRSVKNWFNARNAPSGRHLVNLARCSDAVLEAFLSMSGRRGLIAAKTMVDAGQKLRQMLTLLEQLQEERSDQN